MTGSLYGGIRRGWTRYNCQLFVSCSEGLNRMIYESYLRFVSQEFQENCFFFDIGNGRDQLERTEIAGCKEKCFISTTSDRNQVEIGDAEDFRISVICILNGIFQEFLKIEQWITSLQNGVQMFQKRSDELSGSGLFYFKYSRLEIIGILKTIFAIFSRLAN